MRKAFYQLKYGLHLFLLLYACACVWWLPRTGLIAVVDDWLWQQSSLDVAPVVHLVDIDDASLAALGRWPWGRELFAQLLQQLVHEYGAALIGLDIVLSEPSGEADLPLARLPADRIVWAVALAQPGEPSVRQGELGAFPECPAGHDLQVSTGYLGVARTLASDNMRQGHVRPWIDADGVIRRYAALLPWEGRCIPSLALAMWGQWLGLAADAPLSLHKGHWYWGGVDLQVSGQALLPLQNMAAAVGVVSARDVLAGSAQLEPGALVLVGSSALGLGDRIALPGDVAASGVSVHAYALAQWVLGSTRLEPFWQDWLQLVVLSVLLVMMAWKMRASVRAGILCWGVGAVAWVGGGALVWQQGYSWPVAPLLWSCLALIPAAGLRLQALHDARNLLYRQFSAYVSRDVLEQLVESQADPLALEAQSCEITVLFADIRGFTRRVENLPPADTVRLVNRVMTYLGRHITEQRGTLDKFLGDGVMAFWGAPLAMPDHADRAVTCAREMVCGLKALNVALEEDGLPTVDLGIGVHTGVAAVGNMGSAERRAYSAVGDTVNLAARLQALAAPEKGKILVSAATSRHCVSNRFRSVGEFLVRGRCQPVSVFTPADDDVSTNVPVVGQGAQSGSAAVLRSPE